jgi:5-methylcytosine-specific restriction endonuclease McrA
VTTDWDGFRQWHTQHLIDDAARKTARLQELLQGAPSRTYEDQVMLLQHERLQRRTAERQRKRTATEIRAELKNDGPLRWRILARDNYTCQHCGATGARAELTIDHITPVSVGGTNAESNLQTLCRSCNSRKGARI